MRIEVVRIVKAELDEEEFDVIGSALAAYAGDQWSANPKHKEMAAKMRDELMNAYHGDPQF